MTKKKIAEVQESERDVDPSAAVDPAGAVDPVGNSAALDSLDVVQEVRADALDESPELPGRPRGRPPGKGNHGPSKATWRARARAAEAELRQQSAEVSTAVIQDGAAALKGPIELVTRMYFGRLARTNGAHWLLSEDETEALSTSWATALAPWAPMIAKFLPAGVALTVTIQIMKGRQAIDRQLAEAAKLAPAATPDPVP